MSNLSRIVEHCLKRATEADMREIAALVDSKARELGLVLGDPEGPQDALAVPLGANTKALTGKDGQGTSFDLFWDVVHCKIGKEAARKAFAKAIKRIADEEMCEKKKASEWLTDRMAQFAASPASRPTDHTPIHPATWLNQGRYDDDPETWGTTDPQGMTYNGKSEPATEGNDLDAGGL